MKPMNVTKIAGLGLLAVGLAAATLAPSSTARGGASGRATYVGSDVCRGCHNGLHSVTAVAAWEKSAHPRAMWSASEPPEGVQILGDFSAHAPFPRARIAYVLGAGRHAQAYLDKDYQVLPGEWQVQAKVWTPREVVDGKTQCIGCHATGFGGADNSWKAMGVGCEMCHGPGSEHMVSRDKKATIVNPMSLDPQKRAMVCAQCHSQGKSKDRVHAFPTGFEPGDDLDQAFLYAPLRPQGARNSQYNELRFGGGEHLSGGTGCTTCHDAHAPAGAALLRQALPGLCTQCHQHLAGPQHNSESLTRGSCTVCHMPKGGHAFAAPHHTTHTAS